MKEEYLAIIKHYGLSSQLKKLAEEVYELEEAILTDTGDEESFNHICEERADVEVMLRQIDAYFDINFEYLSPIIVSKILRTKVRIENEK